MTSVLLVDKDKTVNAHDGEALLATDQKPQS